MRHQWFLSLIVGLLILISATAFAGVKTIDQVSITMAEYTPAPPDPPGTPPPPPMTPAPLDTYCDIMVYCEITTYDGVEGPSVPVAGAHIAHNGSCGSNSWTTDGNGFCTVIHAHSNFNLDLTITADGYETMDFTADGSSCPAFLGLIPIQTPTPPCINDGDVNLQGSITAEDAQWAFSIALGMLSPSFEQECAADCNGDDTVTAGDAQLIFATALGSDSCVDPMD